MCCTPQVLKNIFKVSLPVIWLANSKISIIVIIFEELFFFNHFIPEAEKYCKAKMIPFKVLLALNNAPDHLKNIGDFHPSATVIFLSPNTTSLLGPCNQWTREQLPSLSAII